MRIRRTLSCGVVLCALAAGMAGAADFTVQSGDTVGGQILTDPGDVGLIEPGGAISTGIAVGVSMENVNQSVTNDGLIATSGAFALGIMSTGADARIDNSGGITTSGDNGYGIYSDGADARIDNNGDITTSGVFAEGIWSFGADARIDNNGDITTLGDVAPGIRSVGADARIDNNGDIATSGFEAHGILSEGAAARIDNSGGITTSGDDATGIVLAGPGATLTNSGTIISEQSLAIYFSHTNATLNLLAGSVIQGGIQFDSPGSATLNIGPGLNTALTFDGLPASINTHGAPIAVQGSLVAVVDPTGFSAQDEMLTDLTRAIAGALDARIAAARSGYAPAGAPVTAYAEADARVGAQAMDFGYGTGVLGGQGRPGFWAAGIGAYRNQKPDRADVGFDSSLGGLLIGYDGETANGARVGAFLGASASTFETDTGSQQIDADSYFGGLYAGFTGANYFIDLSVTGGLSQQSSDRTVTNNLVVGGLEHASADYDGLFISPSATIGTSLAMGGGMLIPSLRARYAGLFLDGYEESGSAADQSVDDHDVDIFDLRAQLAYALATRPVGDGNLRAAFRFGADATFADNDVDAALLGTALNFDVSGDGTVRGFAGVDLSYLDGSGSSYFLGAEAGYDSGDAFTLDVMGGLRIPL